MRVTSEFWVKAFLRQAAVQGYPGAVVRHGDDTSGAVFIKINPLDGSVLLFGPAPPALDSDDGERRFLGIKTSSRLTDEDVEAMLEREARFDRDIWVIEIEGKDAHQIIDSWLLATPG